MSISGIAAVDRCGKNENHHPDRRVGIGRTTLRIERNPDHNSPVA
ncbi:hypothetical protein [Rhizobium leguminosarum]|jgi:hypothetical protein|nr:hypothetical protein [Rhizobium leguminosarum]